jgi:hypothetical protein
MSSLETIPLENPYEDDPELFAGMNVYLAARYSRREEISGYARALAELGFTITSRWIAGGHTSGVQPDMTLSINKILAHHDRTDILKSDFVIHFTEDETTLYPRGSRHTELGIAYERGKVNYVIGPYENIFHHLDGLLRFETWKEFFVHFQEVARFLKMRNLMRLVSSRTGGEYEKS